MLLAPCGQRLSAALFILCGVSILLTFLSVLHRQQISTAWHAPHHHWYHHHESSKDSANKTLSASVKPSPSSTPTPTPTPLTNVELADKLTPLLDKYPPDTPHLKNDGSAIAFWPPGNKSQPLMDSLAIKPSEILKMREAHRGYVEAITTQIPPFVPVSHPETRGIVTVGGGSYMAVLMVTLRMLRRSGSNLPVEVFVPNDDEYESEVCERVMPSLNAKCLVLTDYMPEKNSTEPKEKLARFEYKLFAILFSSFDNVLWIDTDSVPLHDPDVLFDSKPFQSTGLVTWPDLWQSTVSPAYYIISDKEITPVSKHASSESGQLMVSKRIHYHTLLLAAYYNYYGPTHYYAMLNQGNAGIGDKETFLPAARALDNPYYNVRTKVLSVGHWNPKTNGDIYKFALLQMDPIADWVATEEGKLDMPKPAPPNTTAIEPKPFFLHASLPKWNAKNVLGKGQPYSLVQDKAGKRSSGFRDPPEAAAKIQGVERMMWEETRWAACEMNVTLNEWKKAVEEENRDLCAELNEYFDEVLDTEVGEELGLGSVVLDMASS